VNNAGNLFAAGTRDTNTGALNLPRIDFRGSARFFYGLKQ
jgi:hypothetical protein